MPKRRSTSYRGHLSSTATRKEKETLTTAKIESLSRKNAEITTRSARDEETLTAKVIADLSRKNEKMTPRRSARASFSEMINDNVKDVRATRVKEIGDVEGSLLVVPTNDEYMGKYMLESGKVWEEHVLSRMLDYVRVNSNVVDVGANYGSYSVYFSKKVGRGGTVTSFEPQPYLNRICSTNLVLNDIQNVKLEQTSLGHAEITTEMSSKLSDGASRSQDFQTALDESKLINYEGRQIGVGGESITMKTLDSFKITNLSLLKVDAEGSEPLVFWGAKETIAREKPVIFGEDKQKLPLAALNAMKVKDEQHQVKATRDDGDDVPFGYTRLDVILIGGGVTGLGFVAYYGLQEFAGFDAQWAGNVVQLTFVMLLTLLWVGSYIQRVFNKDMTYGKQLKDYEEAVMQKRLEEMPESELMALMDESERAKNEK
ncbi:unnamed protein product [Bathycoccus prasinos]